MQFRFYFLLLWGYTTQNIHENVTSNRQLKCSNWVGGCVFNVKPLNSKSLVLFGPSLSLMVTSVQCGAWCQLTLVQGNQWPTKCVQCWLVALCFLKWRHFLCDTVWTPWTVDLVTTGHWSHSLLTMLHWSRGYRTLIPPRSSIVVTFYLNILLILWSKLNIMAAMCAHNKIHFYWL